MVTSVSRFPTKRLSVKKHHHPWGARIRFHGYARDRCKTDQGPLARCEPTGLELVGIRWLTNIPCTRIRITRARDTENSASKRKRNRPHTRLLRFSHGYRKWSTSSILVPIRHLSFEVYTHFFAFRQRGKYARYISEQGTLPGILMADLNVKHRAGSLCTVIFGRPLKFPPVVLAWRIDFRAEGFVSFRQGNFPPMGSDKIKRAKNRIAKFCNRQASTSQSSKRGIYYGQTFFFFFLLITKESSPRHRLRHELELFQICSTPNVNNRGHFSRREYVD